MNSDSGKSSDRQETGQWDNECWAHSLLFGGLSEEGLFL